MLAAAIRTLSEGFTLRESAIEVLLKSSPDLTCINLMCEKVGQVRCQSHSRIDSHHVDVTREGLAGCADSRLRSYPAAPLQGCACRLALSLQRMPQVEVIDVSGNRLPLLPDSLWTRPKLKRVVAAGEAGCCSDNVDVYPNCEDDCIA